MDAAKLKITPSIATALNKVLNDQKGKIEYVELVTSFNLRDHSKELLNLCLQYPDSLAGREAARTLLKWDETDLIGGVLNGKHVRGGEVLWGTPVRPLKEFLEQQAHLSRLPKWIAEIRQKLFGEAKG